MNPYAIPGIAGIDAMCAQEWGIDREQLYTRTRERKVVEARQMAMYLRVTRERSSYAAAGKPYDRDHATAIHAVRTVRDLMKTDKVFRDKARRVIDTLEEMDRVTKARRK